MRDWNTRATQPGKRKLPGHVINIVHAGHFFFLQVKQDIGGVKLAGKRVFHPGQPHSHPVRSQAAANDALEIVLHLAEQVWMHQRGQHFQAVREARAGTAEVV